MIGRLLSFWDGLFSGAMLISGSVLTYIYIDVNQTLSPSRPRRHDLKRSREYPDIYDGWCTPAVACVDDHKDVGIVKLQVDDELMFSNAAHQARTENYSIHQKVEKPLKNDGCKFWKTVCFVLNG